MSVCVRVRVKEDKSRDDVGVGPLLNPDHPQIRVRVGMRRGLMFSPFESKRTGQSVSFLKPSHAYFYIQTDYRAPPHVLIPRSPDSYII
jgi:hypothetical protein